MFLNCLSEMASLIFCDKEVKYGRTRYLELAYFELPLISKWKSGPCYNMKLWQ